MKVIVVNAHVREAFSGAQIQVAGMEDAAALRPTFDGVEKVSCAEQFPEHPRCVMSGRNLPSAFEEGIRQ